MPSEEKRYVLVKDKPVPKRLLEEAEVRGWAPAEECEIVDDRRVVVELDPKKGNRIVGVLAKGYAGDQNIAGLVAEALKERRQESQRVVAVANLVSTGDVAARVRLKHNTVQRWTLRYADFPAPVIEFTIVDIYDWSEVLRWLEHKFPAYAARVAGKWRVSA